VYRRFAAAADRGSPGGGHEVTYREENQTEIRTKLFFQPFQLYKVVSQYIV
jgi:hypothetical protein